MATVSCVKGVLSYPNKFTEDELVVTVDGGQITTVKMVDDGVYGAVSLSSVNSENPIRIAFVNGVNEIALYSSIPRDRDIKIQSYTPFKAETTECFKKAVQSVSLMKLVYNPKTQAVEGATFDEASKALRSGAMLFLSLLGVSIPFVTYSDSSIVFDQIRVRSDGVTVLHVQWNSDGTVTTTQVQYPPQS